MFHDYFLLNKNGLKLSKSKIFTAGNEVSCMVLIEMIIDPLHDFRPSRMESESKFYWIKVAIWKKFA